MNDSWMITRRYPDDIAGPSYRPILDAARLGCFDAARHRGGETDTLRRRLAMRRTITTLYTILIAGVIVAGCTDSRTPTAPAQRAARGSASLGIDQATFTSLVVPGATFTFPTDINDHGIIVGRYAAAGHTHAFMRDADGVYTTIDFPNSSFSVAASINDSGAVAGWYTLPTAPTIRHGFILKDGVYTTIDPPASTFTNILGINERGDVTGRYCTLTPCQPPGSGSFHGFVYRDGQLEELAVAGAIETDGFKLAANGAVVGGFAPPGGPEQLFVLSHDEYTTYGLPNGKSISLDNGGVNSRGDMVGSYCNAGFRCLLGPTGTHGFLLSTRGEFATIDYPGAVATAANGINARGDIVGNWNDAGAVGRGFLLSRRGAMP